MSARAAHCFDCGAELSREFQPREWTIEASRNLFQRQRKIIVCLLCNAIRLAAAQRASA